MKKTKPYLAFSELTKRVYIVNGNEKEDVTDWIDNYCTKQKLNLSGIVRPEWERPSDYEIDKVISEIWNDGVRNKDKGDKYLKNIRKLFKAAAQEGEPLPAEGEAQSGSVGCKRTVWCDANPTFGRCSYCGGKF